MSFLVEYVLSGLSHLYKASEATRLFLQESFVPVLKFFRVLQIIPPLPFSEPAASASILVLAAVCNSLELGRILELPPLSPLKCIGSFHRDLLEFIQTDFLRPLQSIRSCLLSPIKPSIMHLNETIRGLVVMAIHPARFLLVLLMGVITPLVLDRFVPNFEAIFVALEGLVMGRIFVKEWSAALILKLSGTFISGMLISSLLYRLFLHPLSEFPGSFLPRICALWRRPSFQSIWDDHNRYGDFVRIGKFFIRV